MTDTQTFADAVAVTVVSTTDIVHGAAAKRVRRLPGFEKTRLEFSALGDAQQAAVLRWLVADQARTGVLQHVKRWMHRCAVDGCDEVPETDREVERAADRKCLACFSLLCAEHYDNQMVACANKTCKHHTDTVCEACFASSVAGGCVECAEALCESCDEAAQHHNNRCNECASRPR